MDGNLDIAEPVYIILHILLKKIVISLMQLNHGFLFAETNIYKLGTTQTQISRGTINLSSELLNIFALSLLPMQKSS